MLLANFLQIFCIFLPAFIANATPVIAKNIPYIKKFSQPLHTPFFWKNKTVRGLLAGMISGIITGIILYLCRGWIIQVLPIYTDFYNLYNSLGNAIFFGLILAIWALGGDIIESFIKRRLRIPPGKMFQPWDGIDYMIGAIIMMLPWYNGGMIECIFLLCAGPLLSLIMNALAYFIGWKECWY